MSGICTLHRGYRSQCIFCNTFATTEAYWTMKDLIAKAADSKQCIACGSTFPRTVSACPHCYSRQANFAVKIR